MIYYIKTYNAEDALKSLVFLKQFVSNPDVKVLGSARRITFSPNYYNMYSQMYSNMLRYCEDRNMINLVTNNENLNAPEYTELFIDNIIDEC